MSYLKFDKTRLVNLEYALSKEILLANSQGVYCSTTLVGCNTRKYHGLLAVPVKKVDGGRHVLLSNVHETVIQHGQEFNLGIYKYPGEYSPKGHKYARWFETDPVIRIVYRVGGVVLGKEILLEENEARILVRYTLQEAHSPTRLRLKPFLAFRSVHGLNQANMLANTRSDLVPNGIQVRLYHDYPDLCMQISKKTAYISAPDWYYQVEYPREKLRGYAHHEDLFVPGYFEMPLKTGESVVFTAGLDRMPANQITRRFTALYDKVRPVTKFRDILESSARKFIQDRDGLPEVLSGFPWFGRWGRFSLIPIPGLLLSTGQSELAHQILSAIAGKIRNGLFPDHSPDITKPVYGAVDTSLWYIWAVQKLYARKRGHKLLNEVYAPVIRKIIEAYMNGKVSGVSIDESGLFHAFLPGQALTWMDSYIDGEPVTHRPGYAIELNGLWYNALSFALKIKVWSPGSKNHLLVKKWVEGFPDAFSAQFWNEQHQLFADYVFESRQNLDVRPNMVLAASMPFSPMTDDQKKLVLDLARKELLTPRGLRTLSPGSEQFRQSYEGDHAKRDRAYHQGTVWPWLFGFFAEGWLGLYQMSGKDMLQRMVDGLEEEMTEHGLCNISEVYDGAPPFRACGAIAFAPSISEVLRVMELLSKLSKK